MIKLTPHQTEKAAAAQSAKTPVYTFEVPAGANKLNVKEFILRDYKVKATKVRIINVPKKKVLYRGHPAFKPGMKKTLVYLKAGEKIDLK
ncbi:MAG: 50S ribosomal protein L23 [Patescibacteria group bacterium]